MTLSVEEIQKLAVGDVFYECEMFMNVEARVTEAPTSSTSEPGGHTQWRWKAENTQNGEEINYLLTERMSHYGPYIYREPQYARIVDGQPVFPLLGGQP